jgi:hypothetical protein
MIKFKLETVLSQTDFIKILFPFPLHKSLTANLVAPINYYIPSGLFVTWQYVNTDGTLGSTVNRAQIFT